MALSGYEWKALTRPAMALVWRESVRAAWEVEEQRCRVRMLVSVVQVRVWDGSIAFDL